MNSEKDSQELKNKKEKKNTMKTRQKININNKLQLIETVLDSATQRYPNDNSMKKALGAARSLQSIFPQKNYSLLHFNSIAKIERHLMFKNYRKYKREKAKEKIQKLGDILED